MPLHTVGCSLCAIYSGTLLFKNENEKRDSTQLHLYTGLLNLAQMFPHGEGGGGKAAFCQTLMNGGKIGLN